MIITIQENILVPLSMSYFQDCFFKNNNNFSLILLIFFKKVDFFHLCQSL